jgi:hypothetical protein
MQGHGACNIDGEFHLGAPRVDTLFLFAQRISAMFYLRKL